MDTSGDDWWEELRQTDRRENGGPDEPKTSARGLASVTSISPSIFDVIREIDNRLEQAAGHGFDSVTFCSAVDQWMRYGHLRRAVSEKYARVGFIISTSDVDMKFSWRHFKT